MHHVRKVAVAAVRLSAYLSRRLLPRSAHVPILVGLFGLATSLLLWRELNALQNRRVERSLQSEVASATQQLKTGLDGRVRLLAQVAQSWDRAGEEVARREVSFYTDEQRGCIGVARISPIRGDARWIETPAADALPRTLAAFGGGDDLDAALKEGLATLVRPLRARWNNAQVLLIFAPFEPGSPRGGLIAAMRADQWIETILTPNVATGYALAITDRGEEVYTRLAADRDYFDWQQSLPVGTHGQCWRLHAWPTHGVMNAESSPLPGLALAVGLLASLLLGLAAHVIQAAFRHSTEMRKEIEERKAAQATLSLSEALHRSLTENLDQGVFLKDRNGRYTAANGSFCRGIGRPEADVIGRTDADLFDETTARVRAEDEQRARATGHVEGERETRVAGRVRVVRHNLTLLKESDGVLGITWDVTDQRLLEAQLRQAQKMEAFGQLAGGVAHDFNNLLTIINGYSDMLLEELAAADPRREFAADIRRSGERAAALTAQLLAFSRKTIVEPKILNVNELVDQVGKMLGRLIGEDVTLKTELSPTLNRVKADQGQIEQVIMNLVVNARDAMPKGGRLTIATKNLEVHPVDETVAPDQTPGSYVQILVSDTGTGMADAVKAKIFEPFFTTKPVGKGTGLGLATVYGIVKQAGGQVGVTSVVGAGTTFSVLLPAVLEPGPQPRATALASPARGTETILLVEDEDAVRKFARRALEAHGYCVVEAAGGPEAIRVAKDHSGPIHAMVTDVVMPEMGGRDLADAIRIHRPDVRVLFMSGYTDDAIMRHGVVEAADAFLQKPFTPVGIAHKVRAVLDDQKG